MKPSSSDSDYTTIKFLYSYGGKILPRHSDGQLRYVGGHIRILSVDRFITIADLMAKFGESCGSPHMKLKCKLPTEDLDVLVSIATDDDLANIIEEYVRAASHQELKIRAILFPLNSTIKKVHPPSSSVSSCSSVGSSGSASSTTTSTHQYYYGGRGSPSTTAPGFPIINLQRVVTGGNFARSNLIPRWSHHHNKNRFNLA